MEEYEKVVPVFDFETGDFATDMQGVVITVSESEAVAQIVVKTMQVIRGIYDIYADAEAPELDHVYGQDIREVLRAPGLDEATRIAEVKNAIRDALIYDPWITDVTDIQVARSTDPGEGDALYGSCTVVHIFGETYMEEVVVNG